MAKDKKAPKRGKSAYLFFCDDHRNGKECEGLPFTKVTKKLGEMWRGLSDSEKKPYEVKAKKDKERYLKEKKNYKPPPATSDDEVKEKKPKKKRKPSGYILFGKDERPKIKKSLPNLDVTKVVSEIAKRWNDLSDDVKEKWNKKARG